MHKKEYSTEIGGKTLTAVFTDLAENANGSVLLRYGNTAVLATAVMSDNAREGIDFFPLVVDYEEKFYAAGQILGSRFMRREGRPSDEAVLSGRAVDRTIRPLFDQSLRNEVQVVITILSIDEDDPDMLAINAASLALATSDIPWRGPVSAVRVGKYTDREELVINPEYSLRDSDASVFDLVVCGKNGDINMIECGSHEANEDTIAHGLQRAQEEIEKLQEFQKKIIADIGKEKRSINTPTPTPALTTLFEKHIAPHIGEKIFDAEGSGKKGIGELKDTWLTVAAEALSEEDATLALSYFESAIDTAVHQEGIKNNRRADGRAMDEVRSLSAQAGNISSMIHGSGIFYRGGTHILSALTLGGPGDSQILEGMEVQTKKRFFHHYNFPPFSVGETGRMGGMNRRMIGHGALAEKALVPVIPDTDTFPYTIRIVSEVLSSNGSSSMGSVCGSTLALMDAGVPIKRPVAGIAMGLLLDGEKYKILTDIQGPEDHYGDMDLKVAGTREGITAVQMDVKVDGVPVAILVEAIVQAKQARLHILDVIEAEISSPRAEISPSAPKIVSLQIKPDQIGMVIGPGGKNVNDIRERTGTEIDIEDDGTVFITGRGEGPEQAQKEIAEMTREYTAGEEFEGEVTRVLDFGAFVKIGSNAEGLVHISEIAPFRIANVSDALKEGDRVKVVVKEIDEQKRINLSIKAVDPEFASRKGLTPASENNNGNNGTRPNRNAHNNHGRRFSNNHKPHSREHRSHQ